MKKQLLPAAALLAYGLADACTMCVTGGPMTPDAPGAHSHGEKLGLGLRHDYFAGDTLYAGSSRGANPEGEHLRQNNTSVSLSYDLSESWSLFAGIRHSAKSYRRTEEINGVDTVVSATESGITDPVLGVQWSPAVFSDEHRYAGFSLFAGVTLPLGDTDRIGEEVAELKAGGHAHGAVHDHDLAMGTGSFGGVFSAAFDYLHGPFVSRISANYTLRPEGDFGYDFADAYGWDIAAGARLMEGGHDRTGVTLLAGVTGEHAGDDRIDGRVYEHTSNHAVYAGPRLRVEHDSWLQANLQLDLPVYAHAGEVALVSSWRLRAAVTLRF